MNFLRAASQKTFRHMLRSSVSSKVNIVIRSFGSGAGNLESNMNQRGDFVTYSSKADRIRQGKRSKTTYMCLIDIFCKQDRFDVAYSVLNEMILSGFYPSFDILNYVFCGFIRIGDMRNAYEMRNEMNELYGWHSWMYHDTQSLFLQGLSDDVTYTSLMNAYIDEGKFTDADELFQDMEHLDKDLDHNRLIHIIPLPDSVLYSVFINGLDNKARTIEINKYLLMFNYDGYLSLYRPILELHLTLAKNCSHDEFKMMVELVHCFCNRGLENAYDTMLKSKPDGIDDGIIYNLFVIAHCQRGNVDEAYNMYKEMVHYDFACHMFTLFALIITLKTKNMVNELLWVIQSVLRSCNLNDSDMVKYLNEFNPKIPITDALFDVLAEKARDGLFLKCSYAPASA